MSSRYMLIEFDDKDQAQKLKKQIDTATKQGKAFRVVGYFAKPDGPYCQCGTRAQTEERTSSTCLKRLPKSGWLKCQTCDLYSASNQPRNLLGVEKIINIPTFTVPQALNNQPMEMVHHFLSIGAVYTPAPAKE